jgi:hypothetical protein
MTLGELITAFRRDTNDKTTPYLWSDSEVTEYANDAMFQACRRGRLITDSSSPECCSVTITAPAVDAPLHDSIIYVAEVLLPDGFPLRKLSRRYMDWAVPGWRLQTADTPEAWVPDFSSRRLRPYPAPVNAITLGLTVVRNQLVLMTDPVNDSPEIPARYHSALVHWMRHRAYTRPDSDTKSEKLAEAAEERFAAEFGSAVPAVEELWINERQGYVDEGGLP